MGLTQQELEVLAAGKDFGAYFGLLQGLFFDAYGPRLTIMIGATMHCAGYLGIWSMAARPSRSMQLWQPFTCFFVAANGAGWMDMGVLMCVLHNAGAERALAAGLVKSLLGLGAAVFSQVYVAFMKPDAVSYVLLLAVAPLCISALCAPFVMRVPHDSRGFVRSSLQRQARLRTLGVWVVTLAAYLLVVLLLNPFMSADAKMGATGGLMTMLLAPPLLLGRFSSVARLPHGGPLRAPPPEAEVLREALLADSEAGTDCSASSEGNLSARSAGAASPPPPLLALLPEERDCAPRLRGQRSVDLTLAQVLRCTDFWLLFVALGAGSGAALALSNNIAQVVTALGYTGGAETFVALFSIASALGRLLQGAASDAAGHAGTPKTVFLLAALLLLSAAQAALAFTSLAGLYPLTLVVGFCFGAFASFSPVAATELFGEKAAGSVYGLIGTAPALGSFLLCTLLAGHIYDHQARLSPPSPLALVLRLSPPSPGARLSTGHEAAQCRGHECFRLTFLACSAACLAGAGAAALLLRRTRHMYIVTKPSHTAGA